MAVLQALFGENTHSIVSLSGRHASLTNEDCHCSETVTRANKTVVWLLDYKVALLVLKQSLPHHLRFFFWARLWRTRFHLCVAVGWKMAQSVKWESPFTAEALKMKKKKNQLRWVQCGKNWWNLNFSLNIIFKCIQYKPHISISRASLWFVS